LSQDNELNVAMQNEARPALESIFHYLSPHEPFSEKAFKGKRHGHSVTLSTAEGSQCREGIAARRLKRIKWRRLRDKVVRNNLAISQKMISLERSTMSATTQRNPQHQRLRSKRKLREFLMILPPAENQGLNLFDVFL
jgi:hypothetical protein